MDERRPDDAKGSLIATIDRVLRGHFLRPETLSDGRIDVPAGLLVRLGLLLGGIYGVCLGGYALFQGGESAFLQLLTSAVKVPLLFLLTLAVTFPSLYVFSALQRSPLSMSATLRLLLLAIIVDVAVLASLGPVFAFFAASTESYAFMTLLNVAFFAIGGILGLVVLRRATQTVFAAHKPPIPTTPAATPPDGGPATPPLPHGPLRVPRSAERARSVLTIWCLVYGVVGAQMGWLLRPFLGAPGMPFTLFRPRDSNVFAAVLSAIGDLFGR